MFKKLLLSVLFSLLTFTVSAVPIEIPVTTFYWTHSGTYTTPSGEVFPVDGFELECNGVSVLTTPDSTRKADISLANLSDGDQTCTVAAFIGTVQARSESVDFFIRSGQPYKIGGDMAVPTFGVS